MNADCCVEEKSVVAHPLMKAIERELEVFLKLLDTDPEIRGFLERDRCFLLADKYLIAMVFVYFLRAKLHQSEFNSYNFFVALHIAHDMEEGDERLKKILCEQTFTKQWYSCHRGISMGKLNLFLRMKLRAAVHVMSCERLFSMCKHWAWERCRTGLQHRGECEPGDGVSLQCTEESRKWNDFTFTDSSEYCLQINKPETDPKVLEDIYLVLPTYEDEDMD